MTETILYWRTRLARMTLTGRKWREVSSKMPLWANLGKSLICVELMLFWKDKKLKKRNQSDLFDKLILERKSEINHTVVHLQFHIRLHTPTGWTFPNLRTRITNKQTHLRSSCQVLFYEFLLYHMVKVGHLITHPRYGSRVTNTHCSFILQGATPSLQVYWNAASAVLNSFWMLMFHIKIRAKTHLTQFNSPE